MISLSKKGINTCISTTPSLLVIITGSIYVKMENFVIKVFAFQRRMDFIVLYKYIRFDLKLF